MGPSLTTCQMTVYLQAAPASDLPAGRTLPSKVLLFQLRCFSEGTFLNVTGDDAVEKG